MPCTSKIQSCLKPYFKNKNPRPQVSQGPCFKQMMPMITSQDCNLIRERERLKA